MINIPRDEIKSILVINLGGIGDLFFSLPALRSLRRLYPQSKISLCTLLRSQEAADNLRCIVDEVFPYQNIFTFYFLRKRRFDMLINLRSMTSHWTALKMSLLFFFVCAKYRVGRDTQERGFFLNIKLPEADTAIMHDLDYNLNLMRLLGADTTDRNIELKIQDKDNFYIDEFLRRNYIQEKDKLIGINPTATWQTKRWPIENFFKVIDELSKRIDCKIIVTGTREDIPLVNKLNKLSKVKPVMAAGKTSLGQLIALINRCSLFITNDGGSMHIASILKKPFIAIFGPTDPIRFGTYENYREAVILDKTVDCSPCFKKKCRSLKCLKSILPEEVIDIALRLLNGNFRESRK